MLTPSEMEDVLSHHPSLVYELYHKYASDSWGWAGIRIGSINVKEPAYFYLAPEKFMAHISSSEKWRHLIKWPALKRLGAKGECYLCTCYSCAKRNHRNGGTC
jgi:hypothetical protein